MEQLNIEMTFTSESRAFCPQCEFLKSRCLCSTLKNIPNSLPLIVLQHPGESKHPLNTVRIMKKSFNEMTVLTGEDFTGNIRLNTLLSNPENVCALLYPTDEASTLNGTTPPGDLTHLIVIDGTWRKAKKMFMLSKNLQALPALKLSLTTSSDYRIRKSPGEKALSTLEASVAALSFLEPELETSAAMESFKSMIDYQIKKMGREIYEANYLDKKKE